MDEKQNPPRSPQSQTVRRGEALTRPNDPPRSPRRVRGKEYDSAPEGFLPFYTNLFDRFFIAVVILIGVHLLWLRFMEPPLPAPAVHMAAPMIISLVIGYFVVRRG